MTTSLKRSAALLLLSLVLGGCANLKQPSPVLPAQIPPPPAELMIPPSPSPVNVREALSFWTDTLRAWQARLEVCRITPSTCA